MRIQYYTDVEFLLEISELRHYNERIRSYALVGRSASLVFMHSFLRSSPSTETRTQPEVDPYQERSPLSPDSLCKLPQIMPSLRLWGRAARGLEQLEDET